MAILETPGKMYALAAVLSLLAIVAVLLRFYARRLLKTSRIDIDDYMILPALLFTLGTAFCMFIGAALGDLGRHTRKDADGMPEFTRRTQIFQQTTYASQLTQTLTFGFTKLAVLLFYKCIFTNSRVVYLIWTMIVLVKAWTVIFFFTNLLQCYPISVNWTGWGAAVNSCIDTNTMFLAQAWSDIFTDVMILSLPLPSIWRLQMPRPRKVAVCSIFLLGTLVVAAGIAKLVIFYDVVAETQSQNNDVTYILTPTLYWPMVESSLGVVGACLPSMRPIFTDICRERRSQRSRLCLHLQYGLAQVTQTNEKSNDASPVPPIRGLCQKYSQNIEMEHDFSTSEKRATNNVAVFNFQEFDDLPDFSSLADSRRKTQRDTRADGMV